MSRYVVLVGSLLAIAMLASSCDQAGGETPQGPPPPEVSVAKVLQKNIAQWDEFTGHIEAAETVEIRPRVSGYIESVEYIDGEEVVQGQTLFIIDQRPYRAELERAEAELARARTQDQLAKTEVARARKLIDAKMISQEEYDQRAAASEQGGASIRAAAAAVEVARLNLEFTEVKSPIDGRAGLALVTPGNLVTGQPNATLLTTVVTLDPVYVYFEGDEQTYLRYSEMARTGERPSARETPIPVRVGLANEKGFPHDGNMDFVDNQLNPRTGTIRARAVLDNSKREFTPGLFARIQLLGSPATDTLLIDDKAILTDQDRKYVYVLNEQNQAIRRDVKLGRLVDGMRVITSGLEPGETIIVHGIQKIFYPGMVVNPHPIAMGDMPSNRVGELATLTAATHGVTVGLDSGLAGSTPK